MICVSVAETSLKGCVEALRDINLAEIRLDKTGFTIKEIKEVFSLSKDLIATFRPGDVTDGHREECLLTAISAGAPTPFKKRIIQAAKKHRCKIIISYHNYEKTPLREELLAILKECFLSGADIAKISCHVNSDLDAARMLSLYEYKTNKKIIAIGMGEKGKLTRIIAPFLGSPFTYVSLDYGKETADGQLDIKKLKNILEILQNA